MRQEFIKVPELHRVDSKFLHQQIVPQQEPVILKNAVSHWPSVHAGKQPLAETAKYLKNYYDGRPLTVMLGNPSINGRFFYRNDMEGFNFSRISETIDKTLDRLIAHANDIRAPAIALQSTPIPDYFPGFTEDNQLDLLDPDIVPRIWIGNKITTVAHYDDADNIACVVSGKRRFILFPPEQTPNMYPGPFEFTLAGTPVSMVSLHEPDFERFPRFRQALANARLAELEPGDALYIPALWWHHVESLGSLSVLVNYWWGGSIGLPNPVRSPRPMDGLLCCLLAMQEMPPEKRRAWRSLFDHFVFQLSGDPAEHIPEQRRGALGKMSEEREQKVRHWLVKQLSKK